MHCSPNRGRGLWLGRPGTSAARDPRARSSGHSTDSDPRSAYSDNRADRDANSADADRRSDYTARAGHSNRRADRDVGSAHSYSPCRDSSPRPSVSHACSSERDTRASCTYEHPGASGCDSATTTAYACGIQPSACVARSRLHAHSAA